MNSQEVCLGGESEPVHFTLNEYFPDMELHPVWLRMPETAEKIEETMQ